MDATTTICHRYTPPDQLAIFTKTADIIVSAAGIIYECLDVHLTFIILFYLRK